MPKAFRANGTIRVGRFVKIDTSDNNSVLEADANERVLGISQMGSRVAPIPEVTTDPPNAAIAGESVMVAYPGDPNTSDCLLLIGTGDCTAGDYLKSDADGKGVVIDETATNKEEVGALALESATAGEYARVIPWRCTVTTET
jgi:hypothetical protein